MYSGLIHYHKHTLIFHSIRKGTALPPDSKVESIMLLLTNHLFIQGTKSAVFEHKFIWCSRIRINTSTNYNKKRTVFVVYIWKHCGKEHAQTHN